MFGLKKRSSKTAAVTPVLSDDQLLFISATWDSSSKILTVADAITGDLVAAAIDETIVKSAEVRAVRGLELHGVGSNAASFAEVIDALARVGIRELRNGRGQVPSYFSPTPRSHG